MRRVACIIAFIATNAWGVEWTIRWEAAKGDLTCTVPYEPRALEMILSSLPAGHQEANADIKDGLKPDKASTELLGTFKGRKVIAAELEVSRTYYSRYFLIIAEVEEGKFMPIYVHQYAPGGHGHGQPTFQSSGSDFVVTVASHTHGTSPSEEWFRIVCDLKSPPRTEQVDEGDLGEPSSDPGR